MVMRYNTEKDEADATIGWRVTTDKVKAGLTFATHV